MSNFRKICAGALCCAVLSLGLADRPGAVETSAAAAILIDADSGRVLYEKNADQPMLIASTTKIMTAVVALESSDLHETVKITQSHMAEGSSMYLKPGQEVSMETLLYGLLLCSGNDAALAVADHCGPGVGQFVARMNEKARELGLTHTSFANPNGLDDENHYSTARDLAHLASYAMKNETFARIVSTKSIAIDGYTMTNHNKLLSRYDGCIGLKTGYTKAAGRTLVSCAVRDGQKLIAVTLKDGDDWADHAALYDYGFSVYPNQLCAGAGTEAARVPVLNGTARDVPLRYEDCFSYPVREGETLTETLEAPSCVFAPVGAGAYAGDAVYFLDGKEVGRVRLYYGSAVDALRQPQKGEAGGVFAPVREWLEHLKE